MLAASVITGCPDSRAPPPRPVPSTPVESDFRVRDANLGNGITVRLEIPIDAVAPMPAVISQIAEGPQVRAAGMIAVSFLDWRVAPSPPPLAHAVGKLFLASPSADVLGRHYLQTIAVTATDAIPHVVDYLTRVPEIDARHLAITGASTSGFSALQAAAADRRLSVVVAAFTCGDYFRFLQDSAMGMEGAPLALDPAYAAWIHQQQPIDHPDRLVHAAILLIAGSQDTVIPYSCATSTATILRKAYDAAGVPERFRFITVNKGHGLDAKDQEEALAWLVRWLRGTGGG
jgi:dienelactone hydrolase